MSCVSLSSISLLPLLLLHILPSLHSIEIGIGIGIGIGGGGGGSGGGGSGGSGGGGSGGSGGGGGGGGGSGGGGGGGGGSYGPTPAAEPQPCDFPNEKQFLAYKVIQRFKKTITCDPRNITQTWSGYRPCTYRGFFCETPPGLTNTPTIASIDFNGYRLCSPALTGFVDNLPDLALFHANSNNFSGTVPNLSNLPFLYELDVSNNHLSGNFPTNVLRLSNLTFLDIRFNRFAGSVPGFIFTLRLDYLFLNNNQFDQPLAADIGNSPVMYLTLANNGFTGPLPASICNASNTLLEVKFKTFKANLAILNFSLIKKTVSSPQVLFLSNHLSGCLPAEIGSLKKATVFDAGYNQLTGTIPSSFACLLKIEQLNLAVNKLYGEVPDALCRLADVGRLLNLSLSQNYFTKIGPCCWGLIKKGVLDVRRNCIPGLPNQRSPAECAAFLARCPVCPLTNYIPCKHMPLTGNDDVVLSSYRSHSALEP
ncbi:hypothetical protein KFK09_017537 [Dendrobium nobile]|uniref:Uncharacterized protein n=1 Tax=Dendrobium nobile TaxID=94219 RepID=A0A8T3B1I4_DENNO|nr:hypothetical protein KFK09_017537 [Dendrobium nobile]